MFSISSFWIDLVIWGAFIGLRGGRGRGGDERFVGTASEEELGRTMTFFFLSKNEKNF